jgi:hypothetical protein
MDQRFWIALAASGTAAGVTTLGLYAIRRFEPWARRNSTYFVCFAAGVLIAASFLHIIPRAFAINARAPAFLLAGYLSLHLFNHFVTAYVCEKDPAAQSVLGLIPLLGIGFHFLRRRPVSFDRGHRHGSIGVAAQDGGAGLRSVPGHGISGHSTPPGTTRRSMPTSHMPKWQGRELCFVA